MFNAISHKGNAIKLNIKITVYPLEWLKLRQWKSVGKGMEQPELSYTASTNVKWFNHMQDSFTFSHNTKHALFLHPRNSIARYLIFKTSI